MDERAYYNLRFFSCKDSWSSADTADELAFQLCDATQMNVCTSVQDKGHWYYYRHWSIRTARLYKQHWTRLGTAEAHCCHDIIESGISGTLLYNWQVRLGHEHQQQNKRRRNELKYQDKRPLLFCFSVNARCGDAQKRKKKKKEKNKQKRWKTTNSALTADETIDKNSASRPVLTRLTACLYLVSNR